MSVRSCLCSLLPESPSTARPAGLLASPLVQAALRVVLDQVYGTAIERAVRLAFADVSARRAALWVGNDADPLDQALLEQRLLAGFDLLEPFSGVPYSRLRDVYQCAFGDLPPDVITCEPIAELRNTIEDACNRLLVVRLVSTGIAHRPPAARTRAARAWFT